jgi:protein gp37
MTPTPSFAHQTFVPWHAQDDRRIVASESHWREPLAWNKQAHLAAELWEACKDEPKYAGRVRYDGRPRVLVGCELFEDWQGGEDYPGEMICPETDERLSINYRGHVWPYGYPSMSDGCDWKVRAYLMSDVRQRLFDLIAATPHIDWLIATEKPENVSKMMPPYCVEYVNELTNEDMKRPAIRENLFLGAIVSTQTEADARIPALLKVPAAVRWVWCRGMTEEINLHAFLCRNGSVDRPEQLWCEAICEPREKGIDWLAISSPTGPDAHPTDLAHIRSVVKQCEGAGVPVWCDESGLRQLPEVGR